MSLDICCICGCEQNLKDVFRQDNNELLDCIRQHPNLNALNTLPKFICTICEQELTFTYSLRNCGAETERKFVPELPAVAIKNEPLDEDPQLGVFSAAVKEEPFDEYFPVKEEDCMSFKEENSFITKQEDVDNCQFPIKDENSVHFDEHDHFIQNFEDDEGSLKLEQDGGCDESNSNEFSKDLDNGEIQTKKYPRVRSMTCETCGEVIEGRLKYCEHIRSHGDKRFHCKVCDKWFRLKWRLEHHIKHHHSEEGAFPCPKCYRSYKTSQSLRIHLKSMHEEKTFQCPHCAVSFGRADVLKNHISKHSAETDFECKICQRKFRTLQNLNFHKTSHLMKPERPKEPKQTPKPFICEVCNKVSPAKAMHLDHMRKHTGEKPYQCNICDKAFSTKRGRRCHMQLHSDQAPVYHCNFCGSSFRQLFYFKSHMLIHTGVKEHVCHICQKAFTMKKNLKVHLKIHNRETPYKCKKCPQKFAFKKQLKRHESVCDGNASKTEANDC